MNDNQLYVARTDYAEKQWLHPERFSLRRAALWVVLWGSLYALGLVLLHLT